RRLACGPGGVVRFVATGVGVWTSADGAAWTERDETLGRSVDAAAVTDRIWVAMEGDLMALDDIAPPPGVPPAAAPVRSAFPALAPAAFPWPHFTIAFTAHEGRAITAHQTTDRDGWSILFLVGIPLGRSPRRGTDARGAAALAAERLERDAALAAE